MFDKLHSLQSAGAAMGSHGNHGELCHEEDLLKENLYLNERVSVTNGWLVPEWEGLAMNELVSEWEGLVQWMS